jgi:DNA mismatch repair protein MutS
MRQHAAAKQQAPNALLFFRLGDFYELFFEDAIVAARELEITLTSRNKDKGEPVPMCGVPAHSAEGYIARLIQKGYRVAICDQVEDPKLTKKLVKREITRIVSPGTVTESALLRSHENNYLAALYWKGAAAGLAYVDVSTGEFRATELDRVEAAAALEQLNTRELLVAADAMEEAPEGAWTRTPVEPWTFSYDHGERALREHFKLLTLDGCGLGDRRLATAAAGALLSYLRETQKSALDHMDRPAWYDRTGAMLLDAVTVRNLELVEPLFSADLDGQRDATLIRVLDRTMTGMGGRLLRRQLLRPSLDRARSRRGWMRSSILWGGRLSGRGCGCAGPDAGSRAVAGEGDDRDGESEGRAGVGAVAGGDSIARAAGGGAEAGAVGGGGGGVGRGGGGPGPDPGGDHGRTAGDAERRRSDPGGYHAELDELRNLSKNARSIIAAIETRERERTGIGSLKVRFNNVFGFYIEISKSNLRNAPAEYERKQTLVNAERFTTPELKELETKVLDADDKALAIEREIFAAVREAAAREAARIRATAAAVAALDVYSALADAAAEGRWVRPRFSDNGEWKIVAGRHPVIERLTAREAQRFIPNDLYLDRESCRIAVITGPNMGGKSTYLRQAALISVMAQTGCYVPAEEARVPIVDRVFTRIGASDNLARGRSTFMVEMTETAVILNTATERSLIVLDEIGRGTATYDGLALAWSVIEHLHERTGAYTLFATHYHELTELAGRLEGVRNLHVSVKESGDQVIFLRKVEPGAADRSYGIEVARLAGLPLAVIERAREILALHEKTEHTVSDELRPPPRKPTQQITLFEPVGWEIADRIRAIDVDNLRPVEALQILNELKEELKRQ